MRRPIAPRLHGSPSDLRKADDAERETAPGSPVDAAWTHPVNAWRRLGDEFTYATNPSPWVVRYR
jgi:hypothetical protein